MVSQVPEHSPYRHLPVTPTYVQHCVHVVVDDDVELLHEVEEEDEDEPPLPDPEPLPDMPQIVKPERVTEPSVYHDIVCPALMLTPLGPLLPEYLVEPMVMRSK